MAYTKNQIISVDSYNAIQSAVAKVLGFGAGDSGYGHAVTSVAVASGTKITTKHMADLKTDIDKCLMHQQGVASGLANTAVGNIITAAYFNLFLDASATITTNRFAANPTGLTAHGVATRSTTWGSAATPAIKLVKTFTFASADAARFFFNAGSAIRIQFAHPTGTRLQDVFWNKALVDVGMISLKANSTTRSGTLGTTSGGYYSLTTTDQLIYNGTNLATNLGAYGAYAGSGAYGGAAYSAVQNVNDALVYAKLGPTANIVIVTAVLRDEYTNATTDQVSAGTTVTFSSIRDVTVLDSVPLPTVDTPSWTSTT